MRTPFFKASAGVVLALLLLWSQASYSQSATGTVGPIAELRGTVALTNLYVASKSIDLIQYNSATMRATVKTPHSPQTANIKFQWSQDKSNWVDEAVLSVGAASATEQAYSPLARVVVLDMSGTNAYIERVNRLGRHFRVAIQGSAAVSTGSVEIVVNPLLQ